MIILIYQELTVSGIDLFKHLWFKLSIAYQPILKSIYSMHAPWIVRPGDVGNLACPRCKIRSIGNQKGSIVVLQNVSDLSRPKS